MASGVVDVLETLWEYHVKKVSKVVRMVVTLVIGLIKVVVLLWHCRLNISQERGAMFPVNMYHTHIKCMVTHTTGIR